MSHPGHFTPRNKTISIIFLHTHMHTYINTQIAKGLPYAMFSITLHKVPEIYS
jgi:hypothetical protein